MFLRARLAAARRRAESRPPIGWYDSRQQPQLLSRVIPPVTVFDTFGIRELVSINLSAFCLSKFNLWLTRFKLSFFYAVKLICV